jgi:uncharacterized membrane protein
MTKALKAGKWTLERTLPWLLVIGGIIGLICSYVISYDKQQLLLHPKFQPNCDLNPIISCGNVMKSAQGSVFGFPNSWIGLASFAVLITVGMALLGGGKFKRWFWLSLEAGCVLGMAFAYWLLFESMYRIHALCPYCLTVDIVVTTLFWYVTLYNIENGAIKLPKRWNLQRIAAFARTHHLDILIGWFLIVIAVILKHFWYYFGNHLF